MVLLTATSWTLPFGRLHSSTLASILPRTSARLAATSTTDEEAPAKAEAREAWEVTEWTDLGSIFPPLVLVPTLLSDRLVVDEKAEEESMKRAARQAEVVADARSLIAATAAAPIVMGL